MEPIRIAKAFDDPEEIIERVRRNGPYPSIATYLPPAATTKSGAPDVQGGTQGWFRGNWAVAGKPLVDGATRILENERFAEAAARLFGADAARDVVRPTTVVVNVNTPMEAGAVHVDIPSFIGANRDSYPLPLLQAMGASGLFEAWRIVEAGAVTWFYDGQGGGYDYWPDGLDGPIATERPPYWNTSLVADNDRMYHRIGEVGSPEQQQQRFPAHASIAHHDDGWHVADAERIYARFDDATVRISILWKAQVVRRDAPAVEALTPQLVTSIIDDDLQQRGLLLDTDVAPMSEAWLDLVHATYYPITARD